MESVKSTFETPPWKCADLLCYKANSNNDSSCLQCYLSREKSDSYHQKPQVALKDGEIRDRIGRLGAILNAIQNKLRINSMKWKQVSEIGPLHDQTYEYQLNIGEWVGKGIGKSVNESKIKAAEDFFVKLEHLPKLSKEFSLKRRREREDFLKAQPTKDTHSLQGSSLAQPPKYKPCQVAFTPPPLLGDNLAYICVTNDDSGVGEYLHLPLNSDYTLSMLTLNTVFPEATGLYYYDGINHNFQFEVSKYGKMLFPRSTGDKIIYITKRKMYHEKVKDDSKNCDYPRECSGCSDLKRQVDQLSVAINEIKTEINELKKGKNGTQINCQLDLNANIFKPALRSSHQDSSIKHPMSTLTRQFNENEEIRQMEKCVEMKEIELIDLVSDGVKSSASVNKQNSIEPCESPIDDDISKINDFERTASWILNLPVPSNKLNLPTPMNTNNETTESINSFNCLTSRAKLSSSENNKEFDVHSVKSNQFVSEEKSFSQDRMMNDKNKFPPRVFHVKDFETNALVEPLQATPKDIVESEVKSVKKYEQFKTFRAKLRSSKVEIESSVQYVQNNNPVSEDKSFSEEPVKMHNQSEANDNQVKNHQSESYENQTSSSDKFPYCEDQSKTYETSSHDQSLKCNIIVQFHLQRGSSFELSEKKVFDFFSSNYGQVNMVTYNSLSGKGTVCFSSEIVNNVFEKEIEIGDCSVYTSRRMEDLTEESVRTQILLESRHLPVGWERSIILRKHFEKFGKVTGVVFIRKNNWGFLGSWGGVYRVIIGFENGETVDKLEGITEIINGAKVVIQRVNAKTVKWNK